MNPTSLDEHVLDHLTRGDYGAAESIIDSFRLSHPTSFWSEMHGVAIAHFELGRFDKALTICDNVVDSPKSLPLQKFRASHLIAAVFTRTGQYVKALRTLKHADSIRPDDRYDSVILHEKASVFLMLGDFSESIKLFRRAIRINEKKPPDLGQIRLRRNKRGLAQALAYSGDVKAGLDLVRSIDQPEDQKPSLAYQHMITGELLLLDHQPEEALRHIDRGCEIIDEMSALGMGAACRRLRAECLLALGQQDEAKIEAQAAYSWSYKLTERHEMGRELLVLADIAAAAGKYKSAETKHFRAAQILEKIGSSWVLVHYHNRKVG